MDEFAEKKEMMKLLKEIHDLIEQYEFMDAQQKLSHLDACLAGAIIQQEFDGAFRKEDAF